MGERYPEAGWVTSYLDALPNLGFLRAATRFQPAWPVLKPEGTCLVYNVEIIPKGCRRQGFEVILQDVNERLYERECEQRVNFWWLLAQGNATTRDKHEPSPLMGAKILTSPHLT